MPKALTFLFGAVALVLMMFGVVEAMLGAQHAWLLLLGGICSGAVSLIEGREREGLRSGEGLQYLG